MKLTMASAVTLVALLGVCAPAQGQATARLQGEATATAAGQATAESDPSWVDPMPPRDAGGACRPGDRGRVVDVRRVASHPTPESARRYFDEWIAFYQDYYNFPADIPAVFSFGFDSYKVTYCTLDAALPGQSSGAPVSATGMMSVPRAPGPLSTVAYLHGTSVSFYDAVSNPAIAGRFNPDGESFDGPPSNAIVAGAGFIYVGPDYLGLGDSTVPRHRYFHADTEASSAVDLLAAADRILSRLGVRRTGTLFTFGFSQGGHAALASHRALQQASVDVTATATVGGVFDVEQWVLSSIDDTTTVTLPLYLSYLLLAYDDLYDIYDRPSDVFRRPWAGTVGGLFDMQHYFDDVLAGLPPTSRALLTTAFRSAVENDPRTSFRRRLRQNAVDRWTPSAPLRVFHSVDDEEVPIAGALASVSRLRNRGANVSVVELSGFDHVNSWIQALPRAMAWFRSLE